MKILATLFTCILFAKLLQASTLNQNPPLGGTCDSLLLTNGKWVAVRNLQRTESTLLFSFCNDSSQQQQRIPIQQATFFKNAGGALLEIKQLPIQPKPVKDSDTHPAPDFSYKIQKLAWLSILGIFPLPILTQIYVIRKAKALKRQLENIPEHKKYKRQLTAISIINWVLLGSWVVFWSLVLLIIIAFTFPL